MGDYDWPYHWGQHYSCYEDRPDEYTDEEQAADAEILYEAVKDFGTNENSIVEVLVKLSNKERQLLKTRYNSSYGEDLIERLKSELSSDLETTVLGLMMPARHYDAQLLHDAISGGGTDEQTLVGILCTRTPDEIEEIKEIYKTEYERELIDDLDDDCSGHFGTMMKSLAMAAREECEADEDRATEDAKTLEEAGVGQLGTVEMDFNVVLCSRSFDHLKLVFKKYEESRGVTIEEDIESEMSDELKNGYLAIVKMVKDSPSYFAERIYNACKGWGTDDDELIRLIIARAETDLKMVKSRFEQKYGDTLYNLVEGECSGHYKQCLLSLIEGHFVPLD